MLRTVTRWTIDHDPEATRRCFAALPVGPGCDCDQCRNFAAAAGQTFSAEFLALADTLGVDATKPAELCHYCREPSGLYLTGGWFHFVGAILAGADVVRQVDGVNRFFYEESGPGCEFGFGLLPVMVPDAFAGRPVVQLDFETRVPWVLAEPEPDA